MANSEEVIPPIEIPGWIRSLKNGLEEIQRHGDKVVMIDVERFGKIATALIRLYESEILTERELHVIFVCLKEVHPGRLPEADAISKKVERFVRERKAKGINV